MGALNTYRDHVVHLTKGMEDFDGFVPRFAEDEGFSLSDEHKLDPLRPGPHFRLIHRSS